MNCSGMLEGTKYVTQEIGSQKTQRTGEMWGEKDPWSTKLEV
jgi:hypothetical protein